ncbi:hypothetical protein KAT63_02755 [Candidatus Parcubacteria bacterium]|nr:hypothetical protein [Candidatus Parcubacteria bacterium]
MAGLDDLLNELKANRRQQEIIRNTIISIVQQIKEIVRPGIEICNNNQSLKYIIEDWKVSVDQSQSILIINVESLIDRRKNRYVFEESLSPKTTDPFEEDAGRILAVFLNKSVKVVIDPRFSGK